MSAQQSRRLSPTRAERGEQVDLALDGRRHRGRRVLAGTMATAIGVAALAFWAGSAVRSGAGSLPRHVSEPPSTVPVRYERLVEAVQGSGRIALPAGTAVTPISPQLSAPGAQPVITGFPWHVGSRAQDGDLLAEVAGEPIFLLSGETPSYRNLQLGDTGKDVTELQAALAEAGFPTSDPEGSYGASTAAAVAAFYRAHGFLAPLSSASPPGDGSAGPGMNAGTGTSASAGGTKPARRQPEHGTPQRTAIVPVWSVVYVSGLPATVSAAHGAVGQRLSGESALLDLSRGSPIADVSVEPALAETLRKGMTVWLTISGGAHIQGHIGRIAAAGSGSSPSGSEASGSSGSKEGSGSQSGAKVIVALPANAPGLRVGAQVNASIIRASSHRRVLVVPISAVQVAGNGSEYVSVRHDGAQRRVVVRQGVSAGGNVAVEPLQGQALRAGEEVVIPD